jgi:hypothetical protein
MTQKMNDFDFQAFCDKVLSYGPHTFRLGDLPLATHISNASKGLAHSLGSEVASKVVASIRTTLAKEGNIKAEAVSRDAVKAWKAGHVAETQALTDKHTTTMVAAMRDGTISESSGPRGPQDPTQTLFLALVDADYRARLRQPPHNILAPTKAQVAAGVALMLKAMTDAPDSKAGAATLALRVQAVKTMLKAKPVSISAVAFDALF